MHVATLLFALFAAAETLELPDRVRAALDDGKFEGTPGGFEIIALSHMADGCAARRAEAPVAARRCVEKALLRARRRAPAGLEPAGASHGLYLTHFALILGAADATGPCLDEKLHRKIAAGLAAASLADPVGHAASYPAGKERWPADQAATLAALARFDRAHGEKVVEEPLRRYRAYVLQKAWDGPLGLPWSEARGLHHGRHPRGCALSWSVRYLAEVDPALARNWWESYRASYLVDVGVMVGFREWPPGVDLAADADSGPIVRGVGAAATAFGIGAARAMGDRVLAARLGATASRVSAAARASPSLRRHASSTLADAILFQADSP